MEKQNMKAWLYLLPAFLFLGAFMIYPLIDVFVYSFEEGYNSASQTFYGIGMYNYSYVLHDPYFLQALKNTFILVIITVPVSTGLALLISAALSSIKPLRDLFQTIFFLPYVTNTLAVGLVFMILFKKTPYSDGLINLLIQFFGGSSVDFIDGPYWAKMFVLCFYTIWIVMPFKILILTSALASVNPMYYNAARVDGTSRFRMFTKITLPMISPMVFYLIITGFIGAFKAYSDAVALFGTNLNAAEMNTIVGYVYDMLYGDSGGYPSYASAAAILLFAIVLTITCINLLCYHLLFFWFLLYSLFSYPFLLYSFLLYSFLLFLVITLFPPECFFVLRHPLVSLFPRRLCIQNPVFPRYLFQSGECKPKNTVFFLLSDHCFPNCGNFFQLLNFDVAFSRYLYYNQFCKRIYPS